ncbi:hypothetical protein, partial [Turicimonas muris]|uniref:hypothetical protein n=1 Tax=Turicimonas muris TaxID=1796652 RepID=UPI0025B16951
MRKGREFWGHSIRIRTAGCLKNRVGPVITRPSHTTWHAVRHQGGSSKHPYVPDAVRRAFSKL